MIREMKREEIPECVDLIRRSFLTVAEELGFTAENAPRFTAFAISEERLRWQLDEDCRPKFGAEDFLRIVAWMPYIVELEFENQEYLGMRELAYVQKPYLKN